MAGVVAYAYELVHAHAWRSRFLHTQALREVAALRWSEHRGDRRGARNWFVQLQSTLAYDRDAEAPDAKEQTEELCDGR